jgi:Na+/phosphate symporter
MTVRSLLALATPLLILLGLAGLLLRQGSDRLQALPALLIGIGLLLQSLWSWRHRRRALLLALRQRDRDGSRDG